MEEFELVEVKNGQVFTTSNTIGKEFNIAHNEILKKIRSIDVGEPFIYINSRGREYPAYNLTLEDTLRLLMNMSSDKLSYFKDFFISFIIKGISVEESYGLSVEKMNLKDLKKIEACTYFIQDYETKNFKIGRTVRDIEKRLSDLQRASSSLLEIHSVITKDIEHELHTRFKDKRIVSEWFSLDEEDIYQVYKENRESFLPYTTIDELLFEISQKHFEIKQEFSILDISKEKLNANQLKLIKDILIQGLDNNEHYKVIFEKCKTALLTFANSLYIETHK